ncbi:branched chain amino acid aminotransferase [Stella humosa]|uniref:Branched-chain-amino-acid aminotransferase n=1 Tax=Stella humosa TaxID=94 RepID=A0A3N1KX67_9PROT|nr:branched-chain amino acid aminotransferase [Stella humosa]ROP84082.1 branched chain amino acid aminotransferase [Stella humosa]BBK33594.1 branched-chain amino acid aminotransferase [Stella humosa]
MAMIPFDERDGVLWMDGAMVPWRDAKIHVLTHGLHYAGAVFEGERVYGGNIFESEAHTRRLRRSAEILGYEIPYSVAEIEDAKRAVVAALGIADGYVRPVAWRGSEMMGVGAPDARIHLAIAAWDWPSYFSPEARARGIKLTISPWRRPAPNMAPVESKASGLYMICTMSRHAAEKQGFHDALMLDYRGFLAEGTGANLFLAIDGRLHTPTADCFLDGITRRTVMRLARERQIEVVERHVLPDELACASEVFLTGSAAEVTPVGQIDDLTFTPGAMCQALYDDYMALVRGTPRPALS